MKTVILLRHADVDAPPGAAPDDWPLNARGQARAETLARVLGAAGVSAVFASPALRTQLTVKPLAQERGLPTQVPPTQAQLVAAALSAQAGDVVLIAGHSNTVPQLLVALGVPFADPLISGHDDLFVVTVAGAGAAGVVRLKYGEPTP
jgi:phosphohistidine phosphatase SixA